MISFAYFPVIKIFQRN